MLSNDIENAALFERYLEICNKALENNKKRFPYKEILKALHTMRESDNVEVRIINDHPQPKIMMKRKDETVEAFPCTDEAEALNAKKWNVSKSYLEDVIRNPDIYIENPALIDWEWIAE